MQVERTGNYLKWSGFLRMIPGKQLMATFFYGTFRILAATIWPYFLYRYLKSASLPRFTDLLPGVLVVLLLFAGSGIASYRQSAINIRLLKNFSLELADRIWKKMNALDWLTFHQRNRVYYFDMMMMEAWRLRSAMGAVLEVLAVNGIIAAALIVVIALISFPLFLLCLGALGVLGGLHLYSMRRQRPAVQRFHAAWRAQHHWVAKSVDQFDLIKMGRGYAWSANENRVATNHFLEANSDKLRQQSRWRIINQVAGNLVRIIIFLVGIFWLRQGAVQFSELLLVLLLVSIVQSNLMQVPGAVSQLLEGQDAALTLAAFFDLKEERIADPDPSGVQSVEQLSFKGVSYFYNNDAGIKELDLDLERGRVYLWRGPNGSGKSTAAHLLLGLLQPQAGHLFVNGAPADWELLKTLRPRFGFLDQDAPIFMGSIKENAVFGHEAPERAWAGLGDSWLSHLLPSGVIEERHVGERGEGLSGGEAKRIALIRELLRSHDILVLDEPLNHLDEAAVQLLKQEMTRLKESRIIVIISHQPGFESIADEIRSF
ncbi:ATP-binding cassette domain-containing protein [Niabella beijingensis]|uniref:ATP-binding cassette domain-containing protein n=1 Tax=Niabella beijingensis TaxID=2872700 RepID=UPI001CC067EA|nr:ABC transporter ATP-binding protein [Niabella beijingensis]MBZ4187283.1 ABC transporter ATP-binding protein/permease [Niabella beijingensis]